MAVSWPQPFRSRFRLPKIDWFCKQNTNNIWLLMKTIQDWIPLPLSFDQIQKVKTSFNSIFQNSNFFAGIQLNIKKALIFKHASCSQCNTN